MSDSNPLAEFVSALTRVTAKVNEVEDETADALAEAARTGTVLFTKLFEN
jgi:hypothetical protein